MSTSVKNPLSESQSWSNVAKNYADLADWVMTPFAKKALEYSRLTPSSKILDVACGTGIMTLLAAPHVAHVDALDFSDEMLKDLQLRMEKRNLQNIELIHGDGQALPFNDNTYDYTYSLFGLMFFPDRQKGFNEMFRTLKPGGIGLVTSWATTQKSSLMRLTSEIITAVISDAPSPRANSLTLENPEVFKNEMKLAGFSSVEIHEYQAELPLITPQLFWKLMSEGGAPIALLKSKYSQEEWSEIEQKISHYINANYHDKTVHLNTTAYFGIGIKI